MRNATMSTKILLLCVVGVGLILTRLLPYLNTMIPDWVVFAAGYTTLVYLFRYGAVRQLTLLLAGLVAAYVWNISGDPQRAEQMGILIFSVTAIFFMKSFIEQVRDLD